MNMKKQKSGKIKPILIKQMLDLIVALVTNRKEIKSKSNLYGKQDKWSEIKF